MNDSRDRAHRAWRAADRIRRLSDDMIKVGPWGLGLDGVLAWVPGVGTVYSLGAGGLLLYEATQAGASRATLTRMAAWLAADSAFSGVPVIGWAIDTFFRGHRMAALALQKDIERRHGAPELAEGGGLAAGDAPMRDVTPGRRPG
ncbi:DUF4112 domain-containing protein [Phenylobacterium sp.]|uniref:DUF4112 domain-containing protein n=1 Tax=Phenylobacterium sp. TaxID=1871053 RepID=UPI002FE274CE